jgi:endonuclease YncB( thermonuclease family)
MRRLLTNCASRLCPCISGTNAETDAKRDESLSDLIPTPKYEWKNTIPFIPPLGTGHVIKVYDGDTITIASSLPYPNSPIYRFPVRFNGIDSPEMHGKNEDEKQAAKAAQQALEKLILHQDVVLKNVQTEKYGRVLADVYLGDVHINGWMIENHYAVKYDGGTKITPKSWLRFQSTGKYD